MILERNKIINNHKRRRRRKFTSLKIVEFVDRQTKFNGSSERSHLQARTTTKCPFQTNAATLLVFGLIAFSSLGSGVTLAQLQQQQFLIPKHNLENFTIPESQPVNSVVYQLKANDPLNANRRFSYFVTGDTLSVNETTGEVKLVRQLDREKQAQITVVVSVFDATSRNESPLESRRRTIIVQDIDDSWPVFKPHQKFSIIDEPHAARYSYQVEVSEQASPGSIVISEIIVTDADEGPNAEIVFECRPKQSMISACDKFGVEQRRLGTGKYSLTIRTKAPLDYEQVQSYKLKVVARGRRPSPVTGAPLESEATININLINVQDEGPVFVNAPYTLSMREGLKVGTRLLSLIVQDGDAAPQRDLSMIIVPGPFAEFFKVTKDPDQSKIWYIESNSTIDREDPLISDSGNIFNISLLAAEVNDTGLPVASNEEILTAFREPAYPRSTLKRENVTVLILDVPDSKPIFMQSNSGEPITSGSVTINVSESISIGTSVPNLDLSVYDVDQGINSRFNLSLIDSDIGPQASLAFALESEMIYGKAEIVIRVINSSLIDYEVPDLRTYKFILVASKNSDNQLVQTLDVQFNIIDANDNLPEFERDQYVIEIPEGTPPGTVVATIKANDRDSGSFGRVDYMMRGMGASKFKLVSNEGKIMINDCGVSQCLDYEIQPSYSLTYEARDGGGRTRNVSVLINIIDINDHAPRFSEQIYRRELISDNLSSKHNYISPQLIVRARDDDGPTQGRNNITYRIQSTNLTGLEVDPTLGLVYLSQPIDLDGMISQINSNLRTADKKIVFEAEVVAEDNGSPPLNTSAKVLLAVRGDRDGAPQFKQDLYQVSVLESQPIGKPFFQVQAIDPDDKDSHLRYSMGYDLHDLIGVNALTGELSFKSKVDFDDFQGSPYNVTVITTDNSKPYPLKASTQVNILILDVNNKPPKFEEREYKTILVQSKTKKGDVVLQVNAFDPDMNSSLNYSIVEGETIVNDRNGQPFTLDNIENSTIGYLSQMSKSDRRILVASVSNMFELVRRNGTIRLKAEPDYSFASSIMVKVQVRDLNQEVFTPNNELQTDIVTCTFFLQTHFDRSPAFAPPWSVDRREYNISILEELSVGTPVFSLLARDVATNSRIETFEKILESDPKDYFKVDQNGIISVNRRIDYEDLPQSKRLSFIVKAISSEDSFSIATLLVNVIDLNDNAPQFKNASYSTSISESMTFPQDVLTVTADDSDGNSFGQVHYSLSGYSSEYFTIDAKKGTIRVKKNIKLDRDSEPFHSLIVTASDCNDTRGNTSPQDLSYQPMDLMRHFETSGCKKSSVFVNITLIDENDNEPVFINVNKLNEFDAIVSETATVGTIIAQAKALDLDAGLNGQVTYEIVQGGDAISRSIDIDQSGFISVVEPLSGMGRSNPYKISIRAYDHGTSSRQSFATLLLTVTDVVANDGVPKFLRPRLDEIISLNENSGPSTFVYQVKAVDPDEESEGKLMYKFTHLSDVFDIDPFTGVIKTQNRPHLFLDRELVPNYTLIVVAHDLGSPPKQAHQVLNIQITDINDNEPYFERGVDDPPIFMHIEEEVPRDTLIGTLQAIDKDVGQNGLIGYEIIEGNHNNIFRLNYDPIEGQEIISSSPCRIYSNSRLDRETRDNYTLTIKASSLSKMRNSFMHQLKDPLSGRSPFNQYNESDFSKIRVTIKLLDINDNRPVFPHQGAKSIIDSTAETYSQLMVFKAIDADLSTSDMHYSILDTLYFSDSKLRPEDSSDLAQSAIRMKHVFVIDSLSGILRNAVSLRPYTDGYFELYIKADSRPIDRSSSTGNIGEDSVQDKKFNHLNVSRCQDEGSSVKSGALDSKSQKPSVRMPFAELENCFVAVTKATVFVTHQRETFRFIFDKTKLNDRYDEFKSKLQNALEEMMFEPAQAQASIEDNRMGKELSTRAEKIYLNTFNTDFFEREDGSLDFSTLTSCSQLVKFDDRSDQQNELPKFSVGASSSNGANQIVPNQVVNYDEVVNLLKTLNSTQMRQQKSSLFSHYGLVNIERCLSDKTSYRMTLAERVSLYFAATIALVGALLALIVSRMRKSYEKNLKLLQRSKYQYMGPYATIQPGMASPSHHTSVSSLQRGNLAAMPYSNPHLDGLEGPSYDTWQL